jgi:hypothetical protein
VKRVERKRGEVRSWQRECGQRKTLQWNDPLSMSVSMYAILAFTSSLALDLLWFDHT